MIKSKILKFVLIVGGLVLLSLLTLSSLINIYEKRSKISKFLTYNIGIGHVETGDTYKLNKEDIYWANEILNGGYILHFRHAERDKWIDVQMYDSLESDVHQNGENYTRFAENDYFADAVCLNARGKIQAEAIGEHINNINLPLGPVLSSVSCRSRQTAEIAFGGYDSIHRILVHAGPYNEEPSNRLQKLKNFYSEVPILKGKNTIISAHNSVIECKMFINPCRKKPDLEEGGFYIISKKKNGLYLEHEFHFFKTFAQVFYER